MKILLIKRANEPAKGQWWFPGGRVHYLETRSQAASRKLREECGLESSSLAELGTFDVILEMPHEKSARHGITTLFQVEVGTQINFILNAYCLEADWRLPKEWLSEELHFFIRRNLTMLVENRNK